MAGIPGVLAQALADRYEIQSVAGVGGMAVVYRARDLKHDRTVAIKVLRPELSATIGVDRFLAEIRVTANLQHPFILPLFDSGAAGGFLYYVMPFVEGESLRDRMDREGPLPPMEALRITRQVAVALKVAHARGIVHRDIKPANIQLLGEEAIVADFGIALAMDTAAGDRLTGTGFAVGTPAYMSPEQVLDDRELGGRTDVYSLGCVLFEMLTGSPPFAGDKPLAVVSRRLSEATPSIRDVDIELPDEAIAVLEGMLTPAPGDRCAAAEVVMRLSGLTGHDSQETAKPKRRRPWVPRLLGAAAVTVVAVFLLLQLGSKQVPTPATPARSETRLAVFPFLYFGSPAYEHLAGGIVGLLSTGLDGVGPVRTVDPHAVFGLVEQDGGGSMTPERARDLARFLGASRYVLGTIQESGDALTITASVWATTGADTALARRTVQGDASDEILLIINGLITRLLTTLGVSAPAPRIESMSTSSVVALNDYLRGDLALRQSEYETAERFFRSALAADSGYAVVWYSLSRVANSTGASQLEPALKALEFRDRLSDRDRRLAEAHVAFLQVEAAEAARMYRTLLRDYPDDVASLFGLADTQFHWSPLMGWPMDGVREGFERVLYFQPDHGDALWHAAWAAALVGDTEGATRGIERMRAAGQGTYWYPVFDTYFAYSQGDRDAQARAIDTLAQLDDVRKYLSVTLMTTLVDLSPARAIVERTLVTPDRPPEVRAFGYVLAAHLALAGGRREVAAADLDRVAAIDPELAAEYRAYFGTIPFLPVSPDQLEALRVRVSEDTGVDRGPQTEENPWFHPHAGVRRELRWYLLGSLSARLGDIAGVRAYADSLESGVNPAAPTVGRALARRVETQEAFYMGRYGDVVTGFGDASARGLWERAYGSSFFSRPTERFMLARSLEALGRADDAHAVYSSLWMQQGLDVAFRAFAEYRRARLYDEAGDVTRAREHYRRFLSLWGNADDELQEFVVTARNRVSTLGDQGHHE